MTPRSARTLGIVAAVLVGVGIYVSRSVREPECTGGIFVELRPPLAAPGRYQFRLELGDERVCTFEITPGEKSRAPRPACGAPIELTTRVSGAEHAIVALTIGARPDKLRLLVRREEEHLYDTWLTPSYAPYATRRDESKHFCGDRAFLEPPCVRGSSSCLPFVASCDGPEDCTEGKVCCVSPEWGREYGAKSASECSTPSRCLDRFARIACQRDEHCPEGMSCSDTSLSRDFTTQLRACRAK